MNLNKSTAFALETCILLGIVITAAGLLIAETSVGDIVLKIGIFVLICSPVVSIAASYLVLLEKKDWRWLKVATVLIAVLAAGVVSHMLH